MKFTQVEPDENFDVIRLVSENGRWELGVWRVLFGYRVRAGIVGSNWVNMDYCAGDNPVFLIELLLVCQKIFEALPETIMGGDLERLMPTYERKPINHDPCWLKLQDLSARLANEPVMPNPEEHVAA